jgi:hypothetical protein
MHYVVQLLPAKIASALPVFVRRLPDGESTLAHKDLLIGKDSASKHWFGVAERRKDTGEPLQRQYLFSVDDEGRLVAIDDRASAMASEQVVEGGVARALLVALTAHQDSGSKVPIATVGWRTTDQVVTVMFVPARSTDEGAVIGGATSLGVETHYHVDRGELKVIRTTLAR